MAAAAAVSAAAAPDTSPPRFWLVMDFEATCEAGQRNWQHEIIEFPAVLVDSASGTVVAEFRSLVKPTERPKLTEFCTGLTTITQEQVDAAPELPEVLADFDRWLTAHGIETRRDATPVFCGDWDLGKV